MSTPSSTHGSWLRDRLLAFTLLALALPIALVTAWRTLDWLQPPGRPFPGFFVMENGVVPTVGLVHWTGMTERMPFAARITAVDGRPVRSNGDVYDHVRSLPVGTPVTYTIEEDGRTETRRVPTMAFTPYDYALTLGLFVLNGLIGLTAGFVVCLLKPRSPAARGFMLYGFFWGLFPLTGTALYHPALAWLSPVYFVMQTVFPATFIHFGLVFPVERDVVRRHPTLLAAPYAVSAALLAWIANSYLADPPSWRPLQATFLYSGLSMPIFLGLLAYSYWENRTPLVRPRLQAVIPGFVVGATAAIYGFFSTGLDGDFPINLIAITPIVFFLSIAYAITAHDAFDITQVLRRTALYFTLTLVIASAYAALVAAFTFIVPARDVVSSLAFQIPVFVIFGLLLQPIRDRLQKLIDGAFFRGTVDYRRTVGDVSAALVSLLDLDKILERVATTVTESFSLDGFAAVLWSDDQTSIWRPTAPRRPDDLSQQGIDVLRTELGARGTHPIALVDAETGARLEPRLAAALGEPSPALVVPLGTGRGSLGAFLLGPKRSGLAFSRDDLDLLSTLAAHGAVALQNALSYRSLQELATSLEERVHSRTMELQRSNTELADAYRQLQRTQHQLLQSEKMASLGQLVAGVAHEINNPVSFIVGNLRPVQAKLAALDTAARRHGDPELRTLVQRLARMFETIGRGAERTASIVHDLRTFSRVGDVARVPWDVQESLEVSLRLLKPKLGDRITVERDYADPPLIRAAPGQMNQVFMNLLANACDAIGDQGTIRIGTSHVDGWIEVAITDDGRGIPEQQLVRIFDPFFTTKPQGQGTGLGLSISHGIVTDHGGEIAVQSRRGAGTTFTVRLPISPAS